MKSQSLDCYATGESPYDSTNLDIAFNQLMRSFLTTFTNISYLYEENGFHVYGIDGFENYVLYVHFNTFGFSTKGNVHQGSMIKGYTCGQFDSHWDGNNWIVSYTGGLAKFITDDNNNLVSITISVAGYYPQTMTTIAHGDKNHYLLCGYDGGSSQLTSVYTDTGASDIGIFTTPRFYEPENLLFSNAIMISGSNDFYDCLPDIYLFANNAFSSSISFLCVEVDGVKYRQVSAYLFVVDDEEEL